MYGSTMLKHWENVERWYITCITLKPYMRNYLQENLHQYTYGILTHMVIRVYNIMLCTHCFFLKKNKR